MAFDVYSNEIHFDIGPQPGMIVWHFRSNEEDTDNPDIGAQGVQAALGDSGIYEALLACIPSDVYCKGMKTRRVNNGGGPSITGLIAPDPGTRSGTFSIGAAGPCLIWSYEKLTGGWAAGRTFLPGVSEADIAQNQISNSLITAIVDLFDMLLVVPCMETTTPPIEYEFVIYSPTHSSSSGVEAASISGRPGIQRKRMKPSL